MSQISADTDFRFESVILSYEIDRSAVPALSFNEVTYRHNIGDSQSVSIEGDGRPVEFVNENRSIIFTTSADNIVITLSDISATNNLGTLIQTPLKYDKKWAWSHSFDDNTYLTESINAFESFGYRGTIYPIMQNVWFDRDEDWTLDAIHLQQLLVNGWSLGNHSWSHECYGDFDHGSEIQQGYERLREVIDASAIPNYRAMAFAAPCFDVGYHEPVLQMRDTQSSEVLFNESGFEHLLRVDRAYTETSFIDNRRISAFTFDLPIGRDVNFENNPALVNSTFDWMSANANGDTHYWYNTFSHGNKEDSVRFVLDYLHNRYGRNGTDEAWVAPADQIYSYLLLRDNIVIEANQAVTQSANGTSSRESAVNAIPAPIVDPEIVEADLPPSEFISADASVFIEVAHQSGVAGFPFSVFGGGFGSERDSGHVMINGATAEITQWRNDLIEGVVPQTADGSYQLVVTNSAGATAQNPFTVYTIDPQFIESPTQTYRNVILGKPTVTHGVEEVYCFEQPGNRQIEPRDFLTNYRCGYSGFTRAGEATFSADSAYGNTAIIAVDTQEQLSGEYVFQFFTEANWYPFSEKSSKGYPANYEIQVSADSSDGLNGAWQTVFTQANNDRATRLHHINIPNGSRWIRFLVTDGTNDGTEQLGKDFDLREIRLYEASSNDNTRPNSYAVYGDSLTASAFDQIGTMGVEAYTKKISGSDSDILFATLGLSGQDSSAFTNLDWADFDMYDAFALDQMGRNIRFWGISIGTNDAGSGSEQLAVDYSNLSLYDDRLNEHLQLMIANGMVPILARLPDTNPEFGHLSDLAAKKKLLEDIDALSAKFRLIPGPDFYTTFRKNLDYQGGSFLVGDGVHHTESGQLQMVQGWAEAFARIPFGQAQFAATVSSQSQPSAPITCDNQGILLEIWDNITGDAVSDLVNHPSYSGAPSSTQVLSEFAYEVSNQDEFGGRISGYLVPPLTGMYTFWISADDSAELWLSSDESSQNVIRIASAPGWTWPREWDKYASQKSVTLQLEQGKQYYIEALLKDFYSAEHVAVAWETPFFERSVIPQGSLCRR